MLGVVLVVVALPSGAFAWFLVKIRNSSQRMVQVANISAARSGARETAAVEAATVARHTADVAMGQTGQALEVARTIEAVDAKVDGLTAYLVEQIEGRAPRAGRHQRPALPGAGELPSITSGEPGERYLP